MPRIVQNDFGAGEISPSLYARTEDGSLLRSSLRYLANMLIQPGGWLTRRGGTRHVAEIKDSDKVAAIRRFTVTGVGHYVVEFSEDAARFYRYNPSTSLPEQIESGGSPVEVTSGWVYDESEVPDVRVVADEGDLHIAQGDHWPRVLTRTDDTTWAIAQADYGVNFPSLEERGKDITLSPGSTSAGPYRSMTASEDFFGTGSDWNGRIISINGGFWQINPSVSTSTVGYGTNLGMPPLSTDASNDWVLYTPDSDADDPTAITATAGSVGDEIALTTAGAFFNVSQTHTGRIMDVDAGGSGLLVLITAVSSSTAATGLLIDTASAGGAGTDNSTYDIVDPEGDITMSIDDGSVGSPRTLTASSAYFTTDMVRTADEPGAYIGYAGGYCEVTAFTSSTQVTVEVFKEITSLLPSAAWREGWSIDSGFPRFVFVHQSRLGFLDVDKKNRTFWLSRTEEFDDFKPIANRDASGIAFDYKDAQSNLVAAYSAGDLLLLAEDVSGKASAVPMTQTNFGIDTQARLGASRVAPVLASGELLFASRSGKRIYSMSFDDAVQRYILPDRSFTAEHLFTGNIKQYALMQEPQPVVWVLLADGALLAFCYDSLNNIRGFSRIDIGGDAEIESIEVVPGNGRDDLWLATKRTIDGDTKRYIEVLDIDRRTDSHIYETSPYSALTVTATSISGLSHLEGESVQLILDGVFRGDPSGGDTGVFTVTSGAVDISGLNLDSAPTSVEVGLPFTYRMDLAPPVFVTRDGSSLGADQVIGGARVLVRNTLGLSDYDVVNDTYHLLPTQGRETGDPISSAPPSYTGWVEAPGIHEITDEEDPVISFAGRLPLAANVMAVRMDVEAK